MILGEREEKKSMCFFYMGEGWTREMTCSGLFEFQTTYIINLIY